MNLTEIVLDENGEFHYLVHKNVRPGTRVGEGTLLANNSPSFMSMSRSVIEEELMGKAWPVYKLPYSGYHVSKGGAVASSYTKFLVAAFFFGEDTDELNRLKEECLSVAKDVVTKRMEELVEAIGKANKTLAILYKTQL